MPAGIVIARLVAVWWVASFALRGRGEGGIGILDIAWVVLDSGNYTWQLCYESLRTVEEEKKGEREGGIANRADSRSCSSAPRRQN
jgi:hypothetical protein